MNQQKELNEAVQLLSLAAKAMESAAKKIVAVQKEMARPKLSIVEEEKWSLKVLKGQNGTLGLRGFQ